MLNEPGCSAKVVDDLLTVSLYRAQCRHDLRFDASLIPAIFERRTAVKWRLHGGMRTARAHAPVQEAGARSKEPPNARDRGANAFADAFHVHATAPYP